ncbi:general secretion pathway protein GspB [Paucibacter sp. APW11]|uniref:General secretion pathway protein GspB n=1 Tax=Roseateles aquae TaxID=3077235 RepID=A0ABU3PAW7_9BURK|nr:general secretion pathway protein GspB [Paucibacter sp. APW11]MDT8999730.1 general secretion pathway protein GspB [Paucibacter sp. APW11]
MSYILDALRRAEAERGRGDGAAQAPVSALGIAPAARPTAPRPWLLPLTAALAGMLTAGGLAWLWLARSPSTPTPAAAPVPSAMPPAQVSAVPAPALPLAAASPVSAPVAAASAVLAAPVQAVPQIAPTVAAAVAPRVPPSMPLQATQQAPRPTQDLTPPRQPRLPEPRPLPQANAAVAATEKLPTWAELPEATRQQLPPLQTSGAMYSETPADRMLIVNRQVLHEGEQIAEGLRLEQIRLKSAVLSWRGQRFVLNY